MYEKEDNNDGWNVAGVFFFIFKNKPPAENNENKKNNKCLFPLIWIQKILARLRYIKHVHGARQPALSLKHIQI